MRCTNPIGSGMLPVVELKEVFRQAQDLLDMGLDIPELTRVFMKLRQLGLDVEPVYTQAQAVEALRRLKEGNSHA